MHTNLCLFCAYSVVLSAQHILFLNTGPFPAASAQLPARPYPLNVSLNRTPISTYAMTRLMANVRKNDLVINAAVVRQGIRLTCVVLDPV